jgi:hypothetical protein
MISDFVTWEFLATFAGAVIVVTALTELFKHYFKIDPKWIALVFSLLIAYGVQVLFKMDYELGSFVLSTVNGFFVAGTSIGLFEGAVKRFERDPEPTHFKEGH